MLRLIREEKARGAVEVSPSARTLGGGRFLLPAPVLASRICRLRSLLEGKLYVRHRTKTYDRARTQESRTTKTDFLETLVLTIRQVQAARSQLIIHGVPN
jgi:hypothetical protein